MSDTRIDPPANPADRQVLAAIGNRYVVFGSASTLRDAPRLGPADVTTRFPRVGDDREDIEARIAQSLVVEGYEVRRVEGREFGDVEIIDADGRSTLVEIKTGDRNFAGIDLGRAWTELAQVEGRREIWGFNLERLSLGIIWSEGQMSPRFVELRVLDVWEFNQDGSIFDRRKVVAEVDEWVRRVEMLFGEIEGWARAEGLRPLRDRTILLSEELMQRYAVPDRDMPMLDLMDGETPVVTFKPDGLWLIGFNGLIDVITHRNTLWLAGVPQANPPVWYLINPSDRSRMAWGRDSFGSLLERVPAGE